MFSKLISHEMEKREKRIKELEKENAILKTRIEILEILNRVYK